ncbi:integrase core domain-containing protein [Lentzea sp. NPDC058436]|uniref:integrase core domain-containing protein n=1 Tax=Lentzea sp. NPDC058436 TaxID=3346499 RepID=UPI0036512E3B
MKSIVERWVKTLRAELLDRTLIWNHIHLRHALREYERHYNERRTHRSLAAAAPLRDRPSIFNPARSNTSTRSGRTVSAGSSTSIAMPLNLRRCSFRHAQRAASRGRSWGSASSV